MMNITLQRQLSNGTWVDCGEHTEHYLGCCAETTGMTRDEILEQLAAGQTVRNHPEDWYSQCRAKPKPRPEPAPVEMVRCSCGHSVTRALIMNTSMGTSCPDCYDRMSD